MTAPRTLPVIAVLAFALACPRAEPTADAPRDATPVRTPTTSTTHRAGAAELTEAEATKASEARRGAQRPEAGSAELASAGAPKTGAPKVVDTHLHISPSELARAHAIMDEAGIAWGLNLSGGWPGGPLEQQIEAARRSGRLLVACNLPWFAAAKRPDFAEIAVELLRESKRLGARALKVEKGLGLRARKMDGALLAVDDRALDPIWDVAGALGLPVVIHTGDPKAFWRPADAKNERLEELTAHPGWSNYGHPVPSFQALLDAQMRVVARHPKTTFVSVHFGNNSEDPFWVGRMLDRYPNLYVDIAARVVELGRHDPKKLRALFIRHADRILFGSDLGVSEGDFLMLGSYGETPNTRDEVGPFFRAHRRWLETRDDQPSPTPIQGRWTIHGIGLPPEALDKIYRKNAERLFGPPPVAPAETSTPDPR